MLPTPASVRPAARPAALDRAAVPWSLPRPLGAALSYAAFRALLRIVVRRWLGGLALEQAGPLPPGPKIFALNHPNMTDFLLMPLVVPDYLCGLVQADVLTLPGLGPWLASAGQLPVTRHDGDRLLAAAGRRLADGWSVALCPEGRLNHGGPLFRGHTGAVRLALAAGAPLVPLGFYVRPEDLLDIHHFRQGRPTHGRVQVRGVCYVNVGRPWRPAPVPPGVEPAAHLRHATADLMDRIAALTERATERAQA
jgi:1-acyl-sn-glycerol-3-phosphate acyltransferase